MSNLNTEVAKNIAAQTFYMTGYFSMILHLSSYRVVVGSAGGTYWYIVGTNVVLVSPSLTYICRYRRVLEQFHVILLSSNRSRDMGLAWSTTQFGSN
jgi:hypothetical protein